MLQSLNFILENFFPEFETEKQHLATLPKGFSAQACFLLSFHSRQQISATSLFSQSVNILPMTKHSIIRPRIPLWKVQRQKETATN
jgi:hypothetical protein